MKSFDTIKEALKSFTEETTIEEARNIVAIALENVTAVDDDITALTTEVERLKTDVATKDSEIERLKTENGRLFREKVSSIVDDKSEEIAEEEKEYTRDELEKMFREIN